MGRALTPPEGHKIDKEAVFFEVSSHSDSNESLPFPLTQERKTVKEYVAIFVVVLSTL